MSAVPFCLKFNNLRKITKLGVSPIRLWLLDQHAGDFHADVIHLIVIETKIP